MSKHHMKTSKSRSDAAVQGTNDNSIVSKHSMSSLGYCEDNYLQYVVARKQRRAPLINRGYYIRTKVINHMLRTFLRSQFDGKKKQILSLGAGFDTAYFRMKNSGLLENCVFVEIDFPDVVQRKAALIDQQERLSSLISDFEICTSNPHTIINSPEYKLLGIDLTDLQTLQACMKACNIDPTLPTALLSECVITYMSTKNSSKLIQWCSDYFVDAAFITYEQIKPDDSFGQIMCAHFKKIGSQLRGISTYPSISSQEKRYISLGWEQCCTSDMNLFYNSLPKEERDRIESLEPFDEYEEWHLKCAHYIVLTAGKGKCKGIYESDENYIESSILESPQTNVTIKTFDNNLVERMGHTSTVVDNVAVVIGGFGSSNGKHKRLTEIVAINLEDGKTLDVVADGSLELIGERMFHTATLINVDTIFIFGGRTSPTKAFNTGLQLKVRPPHDESTQLLGSVSSVIHSIKNCDNDEKAAAVDSNGHCDTLNSLDCKDSVEKLPPNCSGQGIAINDARSVCLKCEEMHMTGDVPSPRWRHSASCVRISDQEKVLLFGGRGLDNQILGDLYVLDTGAWHWKKVESHGKVPSARHSHSASIWNNALVISCGLGDELRPLNSIYILNLVTMVWEETTFSGKLIPRYSHTSHVLNDHLWLIGGIMPSVHPPLAATCIDLMTHTISDYKLPIATLGQEVPCLMLHNHQSSVVPGEDRKIMILGGGGNCFSFGTHLNDLPVQLSFS